MDVSKTNSSTGELRKPQKIIGKRYLNGCPQVLVQWQGYTSTWEPLCKMGFCIELLCNYEREVYLQSRGQQIDQPGKTTAAIRKVINLSDTIEDEDEDVPLQIKEMRESTFDEGSNSDCSTTSSVSSFLALSTSSPALSSDESTEELKSNQTSQLHPLRRQSTERQFDVSFKQKDDYQFSVTNPDPIDLALQQLHGTKTHLLDNQNKIKENILNQKPKIHSKMNELKVNINPNEMNANEKFKQIKYKNNPPTSYNFSPALPRKYNLNQPKIQINPWIASFGQNYIVEQSNSFLEQNESINQNQSNFPKNDQLTPICTQISKPKKKIIDSKMKLTPKDTLLSHAKEDHHMDNQREYQLLTHKDIKLKPIQNGSGATSQVLGNAVNQSSTSSSTVNASNSTNWKKQRKRKGPYGMQRGLELDKVVHHFFLGDKLFLFVKWKGEHFIDAVLVESVRDSYPIPIINYFEKFEIFCDFDTNKESD